MGYRRWQDEGQGVYHIYLVFVLSCISFLQCAHSNLIIKDISKSSGGGRPAPELPSTQECSFPSRSGEQPCWEEQSLFLPPGKRTLQKERPFHGRQRNTSRLDPHNCCPVGSGRGNPWQEDLMQTEDAPTCLARDGSQPGNVVHV